MEVPVRRPPTLGTALTVRRPPSILGSVFSVALSLRRPPNILGSALSVRRPSILDTALTILIAFSVFYFFNTIHPMDSTWSPLISMNFFMSMAGFGIILHWLTPLLIMFDSIGIIIGTVYLGIVVLFMSFNYTTETNWLRRYQTELFAIGMAIYLGQMIFLTRCRLKEMVVFPGIIALFVLMSNSGRNPTVVPMIYDCAGNLSSELIARWMNIMSAVIFLFLCLNGVNAFGGMNGLQAWQSVVVSAFMIIFNAMRIGNLTDAEYNPDHMISIFLLMPFLICSSSLLTFTWNASSIFDGDSFHFFSGTVIFVAGSLGQFRDIVVIFLLPQILNFLYFFPQLIKLDSGVMGVVPRLHPVTRQLIETDDRTLINLFIRLFGPCSQKSMYVKLIILQVLSCSLGIGYMLSLMHGRDNIFNFSSSEFVG